MICVSVSDLQLITELSEMSEFDIAKIENDELVGKYLHHLGMDMDYPTVYVANLHRNVQGNIVMGYRICGEVRCDPEYRNSDIIGITEQLICSAYNDVSLMEEMAELSFKVRDFTEYLQDCDALEFDDDRAILPNDQLEENWQDREKEIQMLQDTLIAIRGSAYNQAGSLKSAEEYREFAESREFFTEKYDV